jgi:general secretion pathway protein F
MPLFSYKAVDREGNVLQGQMETTDEHAVVRSIQDAGQIPVQVRSGSNWSLVAMGRRGERVSQKDLAAFTQDLATLLNAGLPLDQSLEMLVDLAERPAMRKLLASILDKIRAGQPLSDTLDSVGGPFSRLYISLIRAGEAGGSLDEVLSRLAEHLERARVLRETVISALTYPMVLVGVACVSILVLLVFVIPQFQQLFDSTGGALPVATQVVLAVSEGLRQYGWVAALVTVGSVLYVRWRLEDPTNRYRWDRRTLRVPLVGDIIRKVEVARFCQTLGTLLQNGVPMLTAVTIARDTMKNRVLVEASGFISESLRHGEGLSAPIAASSEFPRLAAHMIRIGEESGRLDEMLQRTAATYESEVRNGVQRLVTLLEPALIIGLGIIIAGIILSVLVAILGVNDLAFGG